MRLLALTATMLLAGCQAGGIRECAFETTANWSMHCAAISEAAIDRTAALGCDEPPLSAASPTPAYSSGICFGRTTCTEQASDCAAAIDAAPTCERVEAVWRTCFGD